jgi:transposase
MDGILPYVRHCVKERLYKALSKCRDAQLQKRYLIVVNLIHGRSVADTADVCQVSRSTVYRVAERFREYGEVGLLDRREDNGQQKLDEAYLAILYDVVRSNPEEHGWKRPTWTREMLRETMCKKTGVRIHVTTMSRALRQIHARRGKPRPTVGCPWSQRAKNKRLREIQAMLDHLPANHVAVYEDEVDIHLNPKIGLDWMVQGQQKEVLTPGKNVKRYLAGALDARTGRLTWVEGEKKTSTLFIALLWKLLRDYPHAKVIHVILDNYGIHKSAQAKLAVACCKGRIVLHFLPPYCPDHNKIERKWQDLHANVTRNHRCPDIAALMRRVHAYLHRHNRKTDQQHRSAGRRNVVVPQSRTVI